MGSREAKKSLGLQAPKRHVMDPTWWTSFKLGLSRQEETWHSPCPKRNKEMIHDHGEKPIHRLDVCFHSGGKIPICCVKVWKLTGLIQSILDSTNRSSIYFFHFSHIIEPYIPTSLKTSLDRPSKKAPNCAWNPWKKKVLQQEMNEKTHGPNWYPFAPSVVFDTAPGKETAEINVTHALKVLSLKILFSCKLTTYCSMMVCVMYVTWSLQFPYDIAQTLISCRYRICVLGWGSENIYWNVATTPTEFDFSPPGMVVWILENLIEMISNR